MMAKTIPPSPTVASTPHIQSTAGAYRRTGDSGTRRCATAHAASGNGTTERNPARHEAASTSQPPRIGAPAPVSAVHADQIPITRPRSALGNEALRRARLLGTSNAAPIPWIALPAISCTGEAAALQASEPPA